MMPENDNIFPENNDSATPEHQANNNKPQDSSNSDAAALNAGENERISELSEGRTSPAMSPSGTTDDSPPLTTQGDEGEIEENLSGTTNLTLEQLKKEGDPGGYADEEEQTDNR